MPARPPVIECRAEHLGSIREILNDAIRRTTAVYEYEPRSEPAMIEWFAAKAAAGQPVFGIEVDPAVIAGFATWGAFRPFPASMHTVEHSVYVAAGYRRRGFGRALLESLVAAATGRGLHALVGAIDAANAPSIALHAALGFERCGTVREAGRKFGRWLDLEFHQLLLPAAGRPPAR